MLSHLRKVHTGIGLARSLIGDGRENDNASTRLASVLPGVTDGARTHDNQNHNLGLYQLSYSHRKRKIIAASAYRAAAR